MVIAGFLNHQQYYPTGDLDSYRKAFGKNESKNGDVGPKCTESLIALDLMMDAWTKELFYFQ